ncbi:MAG: AEC family transporter [Pseudomonadota bacterium]
MTSFINALIPVIAIVAIGQVMALRGIIAPDGWRAIERLSYVLLFPLLIIRALASAPFDEAPWLMAGALIAAQLITGGAGLLGGKLTGLSGPALGSVIQSNVRWNTFVALSIAGSLYGDAGLALVSIAAAAMIPTANILSVGALTRFADTPDGRKPNVVRDLATNPLIIACVVGAALNVANLAPTGVIDRTMGILAQATIALGLLAAGAGVDFGALKRAGARTVGWSLVRLLILPLSALGVALAFGLSGMQLGVLVIAAATPTATNGYILARQLGGDAPLSANLIALQTVLAAGTMPALFWLAQSLAG